MATIHLLIKGKVQGVFYRASARDKADELGITGWIRNTESEDVEAVVSGSEQQLRLFVEWCRKGPRRAAVTEVISTEQEEADFTEFSIIREGR